MYFLPRSGFPCYKIYYFKIISAAEASSEEHSKENENVETNLVTASLTQLKLDEQAVKLCTKTEDEECTETAQMNIKDLKTASSGSKAIEPDSDNDSPLPLRQRLQKRLALNK